jgi:hypothetical protein
MKKKIPIWLEIVVSGLIGALIGLLFNTSVNHITWWIICIPTIFIWSQTVHNINKKD